MPLKRPHAIGLDASSVLRFHETSVAMRRERSPMLSRDTADCLALANTAILMRLIQELSERGILESPSALCEMQ